MTLRRIQIREAMKAHFDKEQRLFHKGIKVLSLFFIDEVAKYRQYTPDDEEGEYAGIFEEEYQRLNEVLTWMKPRTLSTSIALTPHRHNRHYSTASPFVTP